MREARWALLLVRALSGAFRFEGREYPYHLGIYNRSDSTERTVELPIAWRELQLTRGGRILEVGNVLSHYFPIQHEVIDKYEVDPVAINVDVVDFSPAARYDFIVSISTLEHVGWDEEPREPGKALRAINHLRDLLAPNGRMLVTFPLAYNPELDSLVADGRLPVDRATFLKRVSADNRWAEVDRDGALSGRYGHPYGWGNAIVVATISGRT